MQRVAFRGWHSAAGMQPEGVREALKWHFVTQPDEGDLLTMSRKESLSWLLTAGCRTCVAWTGERASERGVELGSPK